MKSPEIYLRCTCCGLPMIGIMIASTLNGYKAPRTECENCTEEATDASRA